MEPILSIKKVTKKYQEKCIFKDYDLDVRNGEFIIVFGKSGSGKSTLLNMIGLLDYPDEGTIRLFDKVNIKPYTRKAEGLLKDKIGYLFQNFALIDSESVYNNLELVLRKENKKRKKEIVRDVLVKVGLEGYEDKLVHKCSGGEQQRIAIARLLIKPCELILADEPTGSLDDDNKFVVLDLLKELQKDGKTIIVVTHDRELEKYADRVIEL